MDTPVYCMGFSIIGILILASYCYALTVITTVNHFEESLSKGQRSLILINSTYDEECLESLSSLLQNPISRVIGEWRFLSLPKSTSARILEKIIKSPKYFHGHLPFTSLQTYEPYMDALRASPELLLPWKFEVGRGTSFLSETYYPKLLSLLIENPERCREVVTATNLGAQNHPLGHMFTCVVDEGSQDRIELLAISATLLFQRFPKRKRNYPQSIYSKMTGPMLECLLGMQQPLYAVKSFHACLAELKNHMGELPDSHFALWHGKLILILIYVLRRSSIDFLVRCRFPWSIFLDFIEAYSINTIQGFVLDEMTHVLAEYSSINYDREVSVEDPVYPKLYEVFTKYSVSRPEKIKLDRAVRLSLWRHGLQSSGILNLPSSKMTSSELLDWWVSYCGGPLSRLINPSPFLLRPVYVEFGQSNQVERCEGILCLLSAVEAAMKEHMIPMTPSYLLSSDVIQESDVAPLRAYARLLATSLAIGLETKDKYDGDVIHRLFYENLLQEETRLQYMARLLQPTYLFADLNANIIASIKPLRYSLVCSPETLLHVLLGAAAILILNILLMLTPSRNIQ